MKSGDAIPGSSGRDTVQARIAACLASIRAADGPLNAFSQVYDEQAALAAQAADLQDRAAFTRGPLHGVPFALKDLVDVAGQVTTLGSPVLRAKAAPAVRSACVVERLRQAGAIVVGKTQMVQFALGAWGCNDSMGTPRNPWDAGVHRTPGGSSSGSAVAVASGLVPLALGSDTGGSVRVPAAFCGVTGIKLSPRAVDMRGVAPLSETLDSLGFFARTAAELRPVLEAVADFPHPAAGAARAPLANRRLRLARLEDDDLQGVEPDVRKAYEVALEVFEGLGAEVVPVAMPQPLDDFAGTASTIMLAEAARHHGHVLAEAADLVDPSVSPRLAAGQRIAAVDYLRAQDARLEWKRHFTGLLAGCDALVTPTTPCTAVPVGAADHDRPPVRFTRIVNLLDMCGISVPAGLDREGMPIGLQICGLENHDLRILDIADAFQQATRFHLASPPLRS